MTSYTITTHVRIEDGPGREGDHARTAEELRSSVAESLAEDYGPEAWGGYEGPIVTVASCTVEDDDDIT